MITRELPTEPGDYWFRIENGKWATVHIKQINGGLFVYSWRSEWRAMWLHELPYGEWSRIHDPDEVCEWARGRCGDLVCPHVPNWTFDDECFFDTHFCPSCGLPVKEKEGQE